MKISNTFQFNTHPHIIKINTSSLSERNRNEIKLFEMRFFCWKSFLLLKHKTGNIKNSFRKYLSIIFPHTNKNVFSTLLTNKTFQCGENTNGNDAHIFEFSHWKALRVFFLHFSVSIFILCFYGKLKGKFWIKQTVK